MGRTVVRQVEPSTAQRTRSALAVAGVMLVLLFAVIGLISAGIFVGNKLSSGKSAPPAKHHQTGGSAIAAQDIARAQAQATAIVHQAQQAGNQIVRAATARGNRQAGAIVNAAKKKAAALAAATPTAVPAPPAVSGGSVPTGGLTTSTGLGTGTSSLGTSGSQPTTTGPATGSSTPDLSGVPQSWLVVGYNATFGSGPGSAGSISVINRSTKTFSGVARVDYYGPQGSLGSASASFTGLAPGQSEVLALNGSPYPAGATGYHISVVDVH